MVGAQTYNIFNSDNLVLEYRNNGGNNIYRNTVWAQTYNTDNTYNLVLGLLN